MLQAMKIPDAKAAVDKEWDKLKNLPAWQESRVKTKSEVKESHKECKTVHLQRWCIYATSKTQNWNRSFTSTKCCFTWKRCERWPQTSRMRRTNEWCSISLHSSEDGRRTKTDGIKRNRVPINLDSSTKIPPFWNHQTKFKIPRYSSKEHLYGHSLEGLLWERQFEKALIENGCRGVPNWECLFPPSMWTT